MAKMKRAEPLGLDGPGDAVVFFLGVVLVGVLVGALAHGIGTFIRLLLLFPLGMGLLVGLGAAFLVQWRKVRAPALAVLVAALGAVTAWSTDLLIGYGRERASLTEELEATAVQLQAELETPPAATGVADAVDFLFDAWGEGGDPDFIEVAALLMGTALPTEEGELVQPPTPVGVSAGVMGWLKATAAQGTNIGRVGRDGSNIGGTGTWILWGVELLLMAGVAVAMAFGASREPACSRCRSWIDDEETIGWFGSEPDEAAANQFEAGRYDELTAGLPISPAALAYGGVGFRACPKCGDDAQVYAEVVRFHDTGKEVKRSVLRKGFVDVSAQDAYLASCQRSLAAGTPADEAEPV